MKTLTVVCPVYEEEGVIQAFHEELRRALVGVEDRWSWSVVYVVDRGNDRSLEVLRGLAAADPAVGVLALSSHFGQQAALLAGLDHCRSDVVVTMDADLQHPPAIVPELLATHERGYDVVYTVREDGPEIPLVKRLSARWFYRLLNAMSETPIHEGAADFRLVSRRVVEVFQRDVRERGLFLRGLFTWIGFPSRAVRFHAGARHAGKTKYPLGRMLRFGASGIVSFSRVPLRAALVAGLLLGAGALTAATFALLRLVLYGAAPPGWAVATTAATLLGAIQLAFLGVLGEYLGAVLDEVKRRPHYLVEERVNVDAPLVATPASADQEGAHR